MQRVIVSIDPGTVTLGLAIFDAKARERSKTPRPLFATAHNLSGAHRGGSAQNAFRMGDIFKNAVDGYRVEIVYCEQMEYLPSARGQAAITDVLGVAFACGVFGRIATELKAGFHPVPVTKWKGQLSKDQVARRILKKWGIEAPRNHLGRDEDAPLSFLSDPRSPSHDWDAVGIGLYGMGFFE